MNALIQKTKCQQEFFAYVSESHNRDVRLEKQIFYHLQTADMYSFSRSLSILSKAFGTVPI